MTTKRGENHKETRNGHKEKQNGHEEMSNDYRDTKGLPRDASVSFGQGVFLLCHNMSMPKIYQELSGSKLCTLHLY